MKLGKEKYKGWTEEDHLRILPERILKGFRFLFICLTIGVIGKGALPWEWLDHLITAVIFIMTTILIIIVRQVERKKEKREHEKKKEAK